MGAFYNKYYFFVYPFAILVLANLLGYIARKSIIKKVRILAVVIMSLISSCINRTDVFLFKKGMDRPEIKELLKESNCIYVAIYPMYVHQVAYMLQECN